MLKLSAIAKLRVERPGWRPMLLLAVSAWPSLASAASFGGAGNSIGLVPVLVALVIAKVWATGASGSWLLLLAMLVVLAAVASFRPMRRFSVLWPSLRAKPAVPKGARAASTEAPRRSPAVLPDHVAEDDLLSTVRQHFVRLQAAWDADDLTELQALTTPEMLRELRDDLPERGPGANRTDVLTLHAELLAFEEWASADFASVEFSGMIRERADEGAAPFREVWMLTREKNGSHAWRLARQQALL